MPGKFGQDVKDRVVRLVADRILVEDMSLQVACQAVAPKLGVSWGTLQRWVEQADIDAETQPGVTSDAAAEIKRLRRVSEIMADRVGVFCRGARPPPLMR